MWPTMASGMYVSVSGVVTAGNYSSIAVTSGAVMSYSISGDGVVFSGSTTGLSSTESNLTDGQVYGKKEELKIDKRLKNPNIVGDYNLDEIVTVDESLQKAKRFREQGYWVKLSKAGEDAVAVYKSRWTKNEELDKGKPRW